MSDLHQRVFEAASGKKHKAHYGSDKFWTTDLLRLCLPPIDHALGGGLGYGRAVEVFGDYSTGKTVILNHALAQNQKNHGVSVLLDTEGTFDAEFFQAMGGDPSTLIIPAEDECSTVEGVFTTIANLLKSFQTKTGEMTVDSKGVPLCIGWDSIANTGTDHLDEKGMDTRDMSRAGMISQGCALIGLRLKGCRACVVATNQMRDLIGKGLYGPKEDTPGGRAWKFLASQRMHLTFDGGKKSSTIFYIEGKGESARSHVIGRRVNGSVVKNKLASPFGTFSMPFYTESGYPHPVFDGKRTQLGIDVDESLLDYYMNGKFFLDDNKLERVVQQGDKGWLKLHPGVFGEEKQFRESDWPEKLDKFPMLRTLLYDALDRRNNATTDAVQADNSENPV